MVISMPLKHRLLHLRILLIAICGLSLLALSTIALAEETEAQENPTNSSASAERETKQSAEKFPEPSPEQLAQWIKELDSDYYLTRERATENLAHAGPTALEPLAAAADSKNLEVATRAVRAMFQISQANEGKHARVALEAIAALTNRPTDQSTAKAILNGLREHEAMATVKELGGIIEREYQVDGEMMFLQLRLGTDWKGGDEKLKAVADLKSLRYLWLHGTPISDEGLLALKEMKDLTQLQVYGTNATKAGVEKLREALPNTEVHFRLGALLGIRGMVGFQGGAVVDAVQEDTAAEAAGIHARDVIVKYDDQAVNSFEELTSFIAKCKPGDKANLEIIRDGETITKEVTFGGWK